MPYVVARPGERWEVRESRSPAAGPRSRTLVTFKTLTPEVLERAAARSSTPLDPLELRKAALRAGAPVADGDADRAAGELLAQLATGTKPRPVLRALLLDALTDTRPRTPRTSDSARAAARWAAATQQQRGETLRDLLLLADHLPPRRRTASTRFPRLRSRPA
jgi:hypothetical protein